jgi:hypothetical protein
LASMLLNTLHLPVSHFTSGPFTPDSHKDKLDQVYSLASRDDLMNVFWLWFGHYHVPLDVFFLLVATLGILLAVSPPHNPRFLRESCGTSEADCCYIATDLPSIHHVDDQWGQVCSVGLDSRMFYRVRRTTMR